MSNSPTLPPAAGAPRKPTPRPELANDGDARVQAALAASARAEASLTGLFRAIQHLGNGVGGAREANESLALELEGLRDLLGGASEQQRLFQRRIAELESVLDRTRREYASERAFLIDQQDAFLVKLLDEQEGELRRRDGELDTMRAKLAELERAGSVTLAPRPVELATAPTIPIELARPNLPDESAPSEQERAERAELERTAQKLAEDRERARETVARLQAQRDDAQSAVSRISKERDDALYEIHRLKSELGGPRIPLSTRPPPAETRRDSASARAHMAGLPLNQLDTEGRPSRPIAQSSPFASSTASAESQEAQPISSILSPPLGSPHASPIPSRLSAPPPRVSPPPLARNSLPPEELRRALTGSASTQTSASQPAPQKKPEASTRPLGGYSMGNDSVAPERLEAPAQLTSKPPPRSGKP